MKNTSLKKGLILVPSIIIIGLILLYFLTNPSISNQPITLALTIPAIMGIIYLKKPSKKLTYLIYASSLILVALNFFTTGNLDALSLLLFVLLSVGVSL